MTKKQNKEQGVCEIQDFEAALKFHEINLESRQMELLNMIIFQESGSLRQIAYKRLVSYFQDKAIQEDFEKLSA